MELKDPYMFMAAGREGAIVNITNLGVRGTDRGSFDFRSWFALRSNHSVLERTRARLPQVLRMTAIEDHRVLLVFYRYH